MSVIEFLPSGLGPMANIAFSGSNSHGGAESFAGPLSLSAQSFSASGTVSDVGSPVIEFTGASGQTITLPASPSTGRLFFVKNQSGNSLTLAGNGKTIDGSGAPTMSFASGVVLWYDGSGWQSLSQNTFANVTWYGQITANNTVSCLSRFTLNRTSVSTSLTLANSVGVVIVTAGSITVTLPTGFANGHLIAIKVAAGVSGTVTLAHGSNTIDGSASDLSLTAGQSRQLAWNSTTSDWQIIGGYL